MRNGSRDFIDLQNAKIEANNQALILRDARNRLAGLFRDAQVRFAQARTNLITARYQARISLTDLERLMGALRVG